MFPDNLNKPKTISSGFNKPEKMSTEEGCNATLNILQSMYLQTKKINEITKNTPSNITTNKVFLSPASTMTTEKNQHLLENEMLLEAALKKVEVEIQKIAGPAAPTPKSPSSS